MELGVAFGMTAPYYNIAMTAIVVWLFIKLFKAEPQAKVFLFPWKLLFFALIIFIVEELITILRTTGIIDIPVHINAFFELVIIATFIYALLLQKEYVKKRFG